MNELTKDAAIQIMTDRGYESTAHSEAGGKVVTVSFIKRFSQGISMHAKVELKSETVSLSFVELKYLCSLQTNRIALDHKDFAKYEQILAMYAAKCLDIDVFEMLDNWRGNNGFIGESKITLSESGPTTQSDGLYKSTIESRMQKFKDRIKEIGKEKGYSSDMCKKFFDYWSETNDGGRKMRFEIAKNKSGVFNIERRLVTWSGKDEEYNAKFADRTEKKAAKQDEEIKTVKKINTKELF